MELASRNVSILFGFGSQAPVVREHTSRREQLNSENRNDAEASSDRQVPVARGLPDYVCLSAKVLFAKFTVSVAGVMSAVLIT